MNNSESFFEETKAAAGTNAAQVEEAKANLAASYARLFSTDDGKRVLVDLRARFKVGGAVFIEDERGRFDYLRAALIDGSRAVMRHVEAGIIRGSKTIQ